MKINFTLELKGFDNEPLREQTVISLIENTSGQIRKEVLQGKPLALKSVCASALNVKNQGEELTVDQHTERFMLAYRIYNSNGEGLELKTEEIALIKKLLAMSSYVPLVVGQACQMLEGVAIS